MVGDAGGQFLAPRLLFAQTTIAEPTKHSISSTGQFGVLNLELKDLGFFRILRT